jgi:glucose 1-dehydrogenase
MRAMTVIPGEPDSAELSELPDPRPADGELLVEPLYLGVCGTDREIVEGVHGEPPPGRERLVLGHELLARVKEVPGGETPRGEGPARPRGTAPRGEGPARTPAEGAPGGAGFEPGQLVAGIVRRPDPVPCPCCARGEWDMCRNGQYTERGIKGLDGYGAELVTLEADFAVPIPDELGTLGVLTEPASILAKAWEQIERISARACSEHERVLVTGAGPIGLLAALMGAQRGLEVHVLDRAAEGAKPAAVQALGGRYHSGEITEVAKQIEPDLVLECTGVAELVAGAMQHTAPGAIVCLTGVAPARTLSVDVGALNNELVLENDVVFGSVNANRRHFAQAVQSLHDADPDWLRRLITRTVPLERWPDALKKGGDDIKVVVDFTPR